MTFWTTLLCQVSKGQTNQAIPVGRPIYSNPTQRTSCAQRARFRRASQGRDAVNAHEPIRLPRQRGEDEPEDSEHQTRHQERGEEKAPAEAWATPWLCLIWRRSCWKSRSFLGSIDGIREFRNIYIYIYIYGTPPPKKTTGFVRKHCKYQCLLTKTCICQSTHFSGPLSPSVSFGSQCCSQAL